MGGAGRRLGPCREGLCGVQGVLGSETDFGDNFDGVNIDGDKNKDETLSLKQAVHSLFSPNTLLVGWNPSEATFFKSPLFANRSLVNDQPTAFLCLEFQCQLPTSDPMVLLKQLQNV